MAVIGLFGFWAGLCLASRRYPSEYDWRYMTISSLLYPDRNPRGYLWAWGGLIVCALGGLCWVSALVRDGEWQARKMRPAISSFAFGYACMVSCAVWPGRLLHFPRGHDLLALLAFVGICAGTVHLTYDRVGQTLRARGGGARVGKVVAVLVAAGALLPLILEALTQAEVARAFPKLPWVGLEWRARGVPADLSFAFREWITCAVFSLYIATLSIVNPRS